MNTMKMNREYIPGYAEKMTAEQKAQSQSSRIVTFIASTGEVDRHGHVLNMDNWVLDNFLKNPIIGYMHNVWGDAMCLAPTPDDLIGKGLKAYVDYNTDGKKVLKVDVQFKPEGRSALADKVFADVIDGYLSTVSVGIVGVADSNGKHKRFGDATKGEDPNVEYFFGQELLELSIVNIPANAGALAVRNSFRSHTARGLSFLQKHFNKTLSEIEKMTVGEVMKALNRNTEVKELSIDKPEYVVTNTEDIEVEIDLKELDEKTHEDTASLTVADVRKRINKLTIKHFDRIKNG